MADTDQSPRMRLLLQAPIPGMLARLCAPNIAFTAIMTATTFADALFVGQLGTVPLASLALVFPFQSLMVMMCGGAIGGGVTSALSRALGRGDKAAGESVLWHGLLISAVMAAIYMVVLGIFSRPVYGALGGAGDVLDGAVRYSQVAFGGAIFVWWAWVFAAMLRGTGDTVTPAWVIGISGVAQVALSGALTLGLAGAPKLGVVGPAAAWVICQGMAALAMAFWLATGRAAVRLRPMRFDWQPIGDIMRVGGLGILNSLSIALAVAAVTAFVARYGTEALAGYGLGSRLELMTVPVAFGIGGALTVAVGANFGAGQYARARRIAWTGAIVSGLMIGLVGILVAIWPPLWLDLFTADAEAIRYGSMYLMIVGPLYGVFGLGQTLYFASQGTGRVGLPVTVGIIRLLVVLAVGVLAIALAWPVQGIFVGAALGMMVVGVGLGLCMRSPGWCPDKY